MNMCSDTGLCTVWKNKKFTLTWKIFRENISHCKVALYVLISRIFCQKKLRGNFCNFHTDAVLCKSWPCFVLFPLISGMDEMIKKVFTYRKKVLVTLCWIFKIFHAKQCESYGNPYTLWKLYHFSVKSISESFLTQKLPFWHI